jgi:hypothetical protein
VKLKLEPNRRIELIDSFIEIQGRLLLMAREIGSPIMESKIMSMGESFYYRISKDINLKKSPDVEAEMDDDSGDDSSLFDQEEHGN